MRIIFAFRSRVQTIKFYNELRKFGYDCQVINTPQEINFGCSLSVSATETALNGALERIKRLGLNTFRGAYSVSDGEYRRIYLA